MNLGQMMLVTLAIGLLGSIILTANSSILSTNDSLNNSEFGITAVSLATSLIEEAMGKMYDAAIEDSTTGALTKEDQLTKPKDLGRGLTEKYRDPNYDFNDFDDFNNLFLVYKSDNPADTARTPGSDWETVVPGIRAKYFVKANVFYVDYSNLNSVSSKATWHKKIVVTVTSSASKDSLIFPAVMSFWN